MIVQFARAGLNDPELIRLDVEHALSKDLRLAFFSVRTEEKLAVFLYIILSNRLCLHFVSLPVVFCPLSFALCLLSFVVFLCRFSFVCCRLS
jgi:hypothetical protein